MISAYWVHGGDDEWGVVVAAQSGRLARQMAWKHWPGDDDTFIDLRAMLKWDVVLPDGTEPAVFETCDESEWQCKIWRHETLSCQGCKRFKCDAEGEEI
jgi:hypothetical protein